MGKNTILVIKDTSDLQENLAEILILADYNVIPAENSTDGIEFCKLYNPDLIICDLDNSKDERLGLLYAISKNPEIAHIPFIVLSAHTEKNEIRKAMIQGADDYITKPFEDIELFQSIETRLRKKALSASHPGNNGSLCLSKIGEDEKIKPLHGYGKIRIYQKRETIFREHQYPGFLYLVEKGKVKLFKVNEQGKEYITNIYSEGDFFGYLQLFADRPYSESAEALERSEIYRIPKEDFVHIINRNCKAVMRFVQLLTHDLEEYEQRTIDLAYNSVRKRVAQALLFVREKYKPMTGEMFISIGREDLANIAGTSVETTVRVLSDFKAEGLIKANGKEIFISNVPRLTHLHN